MTTYGGGIWKYDGESLTQKDVKNDTGDVLLISIIEDSQGVLLLGVDNDGVYHNKSGRF